MKQLKSVLFAVVLAGVWLLASSDTAPIRYGDYTPYFMERSELERSVFYAPQPRDMVDPGKIWIDGGGRTVYIVERYKGVHIIDNADPSAPRQTKFIVAPGCMDLAVRGGVLYLDNAVDLVAFDLASGAVTARLKNYFPEPASPDNHRALVPDDPGMIVVGWKKVDNH